MSIVTKAKPQLIRKRLSVVNQQVMVVVSQRKVVKIDTIKKPTRPIQSQAAPLSPAKTRKIAEAAVSRHQLVKQHRKKTPPVVKYITADPQPGSINKIADVKKIGRGKILIIIGNGPSINEVELELLVGHPKVDMLMINKPDARVWPTKYWAFFDTSQFTRHEDLWNGYNGIIFNSTSIKKQKPASMQFKNVGGKGWSRDLTKGLYIGRSSVFASMQIGAWMQYEHIYIVGCDMQAAGFGPNNLLHYYGTNPDVDPEVRKSRFAKEAEYYDHAADLMSAEERSKYTFCSGCNPHSFVDKFNRLDHKLTITTVLEHVNRLPN